MFSCCFILCDTQAKLQTPCVVERGHGHASADEFWETVRDLGYHGDVMNLIVVSNPVTTSSCEIKNSISYSLHFYKHAQKLSMCPKWFLYYFYQFENKIVCSVVKGK